MIYVLLWVIMSGPYQSQLTVSSGSARFDSLEACKEGRQELERITSARFTVSASCVPYDK